MIFSVFSLSLSPPFTIASSALCTSTAHHTAHMFSSSLHCLFLSLGSLCSVSHINRLFRVCIVCVCVCVCVWRGNCSISVLAIATDQIRTAVSLSPSLSLSLSPSLLSLYLPPSFTRQYSLLFSFLLFVAYCCRRECRYFLPHQRSFRVPTYSD